MDEILKKEKTKSSAQTLLLQSAVGFFVLMTYFILRTDGVLGDEAGYLLHARRTLLGDALLVGKPPLFYVINYVLFHFVFAPLKGAQILGVPAFYALAMSVSLSFLAEKACSSFKLNRPWIVFCILFLSPLAFFHGTHLQMETPLIICLNIVWGLSLEVSDKKQSAWVSLIAIALISVIAICIKETILPAFLSLAPLAWLLSRSRAGALSIGIVMGVVARIAIQHWIKAPSHHYAIAFGDTPALLKQLRLLPDFLGTYFFFLYPPAIFCAVWNFFAAPGETKFRKTLAVTTVLSLLGTVCISIVSAFPFPRYTFPTAWTGFLAVGLLALQGKVWQKWLMIGCMLISQACFLWGEPIRYRLWPDFFIDELYRGGGTTFVGVPIFQWVLLHRNLTHSPCVFINYSDGDMNYYSFRFLQGLAENAIYFDEHHEAEFRACTGLKLLVERSYRTSHRADCGANCPTQALRGCAPQNITYFPANGHGGLLASGACLYSTQQPE